LGFWKKEKADVLTHITFWSSFVPEMFGKGVRPVKSGLLHGIKPFNVSRGTQLNY